MHFCKYFTNPQSESLRNVLHEQRNITKNPLGHICVTKYWAEERQSSIALWMSTAGFDLVSTDITRKTTFIFQGACTHMQQMRFFQRIETGRVVVWVGPPSQSAGPICCPARVWQITLLLLVITLYGDHCNLWCRGLGSGVSFIMVPVWPQSMSTHHSLSAPKVTNKTEKCDTLFNPLSGKIWSP